MSPDVVETHELNNSHHGRSVETTSRRRRAEVVENKPSPSTRRVGGVGDQRVGSKFDRKALDDSLYDDSCDFGQFCLSPGLFLWNRASACYQRRMRNRHEASLPPLGNKTESRYSCRRLLLYIIDRPVEQILYFLFLVGGWGVAFVEAYPLITSSPHIANTHKYVGYALFMLGLASWWAAAGTCPGNITRDTLAKFDNYPYDEFLYVTDNICPTLEIRKIPRSKYDRRTNRHIPRFDHFCRWLNQPIGEENYRFFLIFLVIHVVLCIYGSVVISLLLWSETWGTAQAASFYLRSRDVIFVDKILTAWVLCMSMITVALVMFLGFHLYIVSIGMTTNEFFKWKRVRNVLKEASENCMSHAMGSAAGGARDNEYQLRTRDILQDNADVTCTGSQSLPLEMEDAGESHSEKGDVYVKHPSSLPENIYDLGIMSNFAEVVNPRSLRKLPLSTSRLWQRKRQPR